MQQITVMRRGVEFRLTMQRDGRYFGRSGGVDLWIAPGLLREWIKRGVMTPTMKAQERPTGWQVNPQSMAAVSSRKVYEGSQELGDSQDRDTWLTPRYVLSSLGEFDLDPCAAKSNPNWVCAKSFTIDDDGLRSEWHGRVFMNPPFSNTVPWLEKAGAHGDGISLVPASVESIVWRKVVWRKATAVLLLHGRTRFCNPDGSTTTGRPLRSIALIAWSQRDKEILESSQLAGVLLKEWSLR